MVDGRPDFDDLLACVFGITEPVADVYRYLLEQPESTVTEIAQAMECDRSTVNRKLDTLREKNLVTRNRDLLSGGGITYRYTPAPIDETRERMHRTLDEWTAFMHEQIEEIPDDLGPRT